jgi:hypothetical protein
LKLRTTFSSQREEHIKNHCVISKKPYLGRLGHFMPCVTVKKGKKSSRGVKGMDRTVTQPGHSEITLLDFLFPVYSNHQQAVSMIPYSFLRRFKRGMSITARSIPAARPPIWSRMPIPGVVKPQIRFKPSQKIHCPIAPGP